MSRSQLPTLHSDGDRRAPATADDLLLGRYRVIKRLGSGAFATVYAARDERLERDVAVKVLTRERIVGQRFETEARAAARLTHPAIVTLYEAAVDDDGAYLVSELVRGQTLDQLLASGRLSDRDVLEIGAALADALEHAHARGVIHRDVKPSNVLVPARRGEHVPPAKLTDFGVARVIGGASLTRYGDVVGTLEYMAPEQAEGREVSPSADLYALALVLYEALTGANPLRDGRARDRRRRARTHLPPLRRQRRDLPRELGGALDRALRPRPSERGDLDELRAALVAALPAAGQATGVVAPRGRVAGDRTAVTEPAGRGRSAETEVGARTRRSSAAVPQAGGTSEHARAHPIPWPERGIAAGGAALATWWICGRLLGAPPLAPAALALISAGAVLLAPRLGAIASVAGLGGLAVAQGHAGGALLLVAVAAATWLALPGAPSLWPAPAAAVLLGVLGLGLAWPAVAGSSGLTVPRRAGLAAAGLVWATAASVLTGRAVPWDPKRVPAAASWLGSPSAALHRALIPGAAHALLPAALVWAAAATILPILAVRSRPAVALVLIAVCFGVLVSATEAAGAAPLYGAVAGAVAGGLLAATGPLTALVRDTRHRGSAVP